MYATNILEMSRFRKAQPGNPIVIASPARTGSTLVYRIFKRFTPVVKTHNIKILEPEDIVVAVVRDPRDTMLSLMHYQKCDPIVFQNYLSYAHDALPQYLSLAARLKDINVVLRYEDFVYNYDMIYHPAEILTGIKKSSSERDAITREVNMSATAKLAATVAGDHHNEEHVHPQHIHKGEIGGWRTLPPDIKEQLCELTAEACKLWDYTEENNDG